MIQVNPAKSVRDRSTENTLGLITLLFLATLIALTAATGSSPSTGQVSPVQYDYEIVNVYPHDPEAFTQGLLFRDGFLFESTGVKGRSTVRKVRLETGEVIQERKLDSEYFGEGLTDWEDNLVQLTWHAGIGFVYDLQTLSLQRTFRYSGEGWGLARDRNRLIMSDGTPTLRFLNAETLVETGRLRVREAGVPLANLNELEVVRGKILANVWQSGQIVIIEAETGNVSGRINLQGLLTRAERLRSVDVLNGIAYDPANNRIFVTGKRWPKLFEIRLRSPI